MTLRLPACEQPDVSVVIVTHGGWRWTESALAALAANTELPFEVIVVDNASPDETPARLAGVDGARVVMNAENRGFGDGCNQGAQLARGAHLVFLNNDAIVHPGWLEPMVETLERAAWVGAVVPRYLHEDGRLQEAGALLAQDGTVLTHGDGDRPDRLRYRFRRVVDFGGAACMLVRRAEFDALGGFDPIYAPAYYEDVDLCFRLAQTGRATVYEPRSLVTHVRHASGGLQRAIALSDRNRATFVERWHAQLRGRPASLLHAGEPARLAARDALASERVLVLDPVTVAPDGGDAAPLVAGLAGAYPRMRIAWLTGALDDARFGAAGPGDAATGPALPAHFDPQPWLNLGVELVDEPLDQWLADRPLFFDVVFEGDGVPDAMRHGVRTTQPQARVGALPDGGEHRAMARVLAEAGIAPPRERPPAPIAARPATGH